MYYSNAVPVQEQTRELVEVASRRVEVPTSPVASGWCFGAVGDAAATRVFSSALDALDEAEGVFLHLVRWQRLELKPLINAHQALHEFACWCAENALSREARAGREPHRLAWQALQTKVRWLQGDCGDAELKDGQEAVGILAKNAAHTRTRHSLRAVWQATSRDRIWEGARAAARESASIAAWDAAWVSERRNQTIDLERRLLELKRRRNPQHNQWSPTQVVQVPVVQSSGSK